MAKNSKQGRNFDMGTMGTDKPPVARTQRKRMPHTAWTFDPTNSSGNILIPGIALREDNGRLYHVFSYYDKANRKDGHVSIGSEVWAQEGGNPTFSGNILNNVELSATQDGILVALMLPSAGNIRMFNPTSQFEDVVEYQAAFLAPEIAFPDDEAARTEAKRSISRPFLFPGNDGRRLVDRGIRRIFPQFKNDAEAREIGYKDHMVQLAPNTFIEVMMEYRVGTTTSNYWVLGNTSDNLPYFINVRDPNGEAMDLAQKYAGNLAATRPSKNISFTS